MTKMMFKDFVDRMVRDFGVYSYIDNITEDMTGDEIDEDLWFECPQCNEPIFWEDVEEEESWEKLLEKDMCPICECFFYED